MSDDEKVRRAKRKIQQAGGSNVKASISDSGRRVDITWSISGDLRENQAFINRVSDALKLPAHRYIRRADDVAPNLGRRASRLLRAEGYDCRFVASMGQDEDVFDFEIDDVGGDVDEFNAIGEDLLDRAIDRA
jgi:hypothetical protein